MRCVLLSIIILSDTSFPYIYTLSLHDALPIFCFSYISFNFWPWYNNSVFIFEIVGIYFILLSILKYTGWKMWLKDRKSTRLNSSHLVISYAVFCLKKKQYVFNMYSCFQLS